MSLHFAKLYVIRENCFGNKYHINRQTFVPLSDKITNYHQLLRG